MRGWGERALSLVSPLPLRAAAPGSRQHRTCFPPGVDVACTCRGSSRASMDRAGSQLCRAVHLLLQKGHRLRRIGNAVCVSLGAYAFDIRLPDLTLVLLRAHRFGSAARGLALFLRLAGLSVRARFDKRRSDWKG